MSGLRWKIYSFTLAEVIVVCSLFAVMVIWIIFAINRTFIFMDNTRLAVRASNLARWWVELMYNLRDSNWRKCSWYRDKTRLYVWWQAACDSIGASDLLSGWVYAIKQSTWGTLWDTYIYVERLPVQNSDVDTFWDVDWFFSDAYSWVRLSNKLDFTWTYLYYSWNANNNLSELVTWNLADLLEINWLEFYRILRVYWVFCKNSSDAHDTTCSNDSDPKEMRFCVKVFYKNVQWQHASELCSIMTNFME